MQISHCQHCSRIFSQEASGKSAIFCRRCAMDCEIAYVKVYQLICDKKYKEGVYLTRAHLHMIAEESKVPLVFVKALFDEGRFGQEEDMAEMLNCKRCEKPLTEDERGICSSCISAISREVNQSLEAQRDVSMGSESQKDVKTNKTVSSDQHSSRYGLGADR